MPAAVALWLIIIEITLKVSSILVEPLSVDHLAILELTHVFHACLLKDVRAIAILLAIFPLARVDVLVFIDHDTFSVSLSILPVAVIATNTCIDLHSNSVFVIVCPGTFISIFNLFSTMFVIGVGSIITMPQTIFEVTVIDITIWIGCRTLSIIVSRSVLVFTVIFKSDG